MGTKSRRDSVQPQTLLGKGSKLPRFWGSGTQGSPAKDSGARESHGEEWTDAGTKGCRDSPPVISAGDAVLAAGLRP